MPNFFTIEEKLIKNSSTLQIYPAFHVVNNGGLMIKGNKFFAVWDEENKIWSTNEFDLIRIVDKSIDDYISKHTFGESVTVKPMYLSCFSSNTWKEYKKYISLSIDNYRMLDQKVVFADYVSKKTDYISHKLPYVRVDAPCPAYDKLIGQLYEPAQRDKIEWAIGSIFCGDSHKIQKFIVLKGDHGTGKSTVLNIIDMLFEGYTAAFDAKDLVRGDNQFAGDAFGNSPLVGINGDADLSDVRDNSILNTIVSHEKMIINEKYKSKYEIRPNTFLFIGSNKSVKITDSRSGLIRRIIDVNPSGKLFPKNEYEELMEKIETEELGAIANHCINKYQSMGRGCYDAYIPIDMLFSTNPVFNFIEEHYLEYKNSDRVTITYAYNDYKKYCADSGITFVLRKYEFREEFKNYFRKYYDGQTNNESGLTDYVEGFKTEKFDSTITVINSDTKKTESWLDMIKQPSLLDELLKDQPAQKSNSHDRPTCKWANCKTKLSDIDTSKVHYVKVPLNHIVIDFDLADENGNKSRQKNIEAASQWPKTYAEYSKSKSGIHLHYIYDGNPEELARVYDDNIEIKVFNGDSSLRRKLTECNKIQIAHLQEGDLPVRETKKVLDFEGYKNEKALRTAIDNNLQKKNVPGTKPSVEFILKDLDRAYESGMHYDVTDLRPEIMAFAANSTHQSELCLEMVGKMKFRSEDCVDDTVVPEYDELPIIFFDVEVFPNLFVLVYKLQGKENKCIQMINPYREMVEELIHKYRLVGFNNRKYDNHILYAWIQGYSNLELYNLSQRIINDSPNSKIQSAYNISYTDIYDYSIKKQSLKKWEIELGIHHLELGLPWDKPVPKELWEKVAEYCCNDVEATEAVWDATQSDFVAREILADLTGGTCNMTTNTLITKLLFGDDKNPELVYTDLRTGEQY